MNKILQKFVDDGFIDVNKAQIIENAINDKENIIVSGHRSAGIRPFMANLMMLIKSKYKTVQIKSNDDFNNECDYYLIVGIDKITHENTVLKAIESKSSFITIKEPEHPFSLMKLIKIVSKKDKNHNKVYYLIDADKKDDIPFVTRITKFKLDENQKLKKEIF